MLLSLSGYARDGFSHTLLRRLAEEHVEESIPICVGLGSRFSSNDLNVSADDVLTGLLGAETGPCHQRAGPGTSCPGPSLSGPAGPQVSRRSSPGPANWWWLPVSVPDAWRNSVIAPPTWKLSEVRIRNVMAKVSSKKVRLCAVATR